MSREALLEVLKRASEEDSFLAQMADDTVRALKNYELTWEERAALSSGDILWIEARIGKIDDRLRTWLDCRLQQEKW